MKVILSYRDYYGTYHNHKESVIYTTAGLFFTLLGFIANWKDDILYPLDFALAIISVILIFLFINNQFRLREDAARIAGACTDLIAKLIDKDTKIALMNSRETFHEKTWGNDGNKLPGALVELLESDNRCYNRIKIQENLIYTGMFLGTLIILVYITIAK